MAPPSAADGTDEGAGAGVCVCVDGRVKTPAAAWQCCFAAAAAAAAVVAAAAVAARGGVRRVVGFRWWGAGGRGVAHMREGGWVGEVGKV